MGFLDYFRDLKENLPLGEIWLEYKTEIILSVSAIGIIGLIIYLGVKNKG